MARVRVGVLGSGRCQRRKKRHSSSAKPLLYIYTAVQRCAILSYLIFRRHRKTQVVNQGHFFFLIAALLATASVNRYLRLRPRGDESHSFQRLGARHKNQLAWHHFFPNRIPPSRYGYSKIAVDTKIGQSAVKSRNIYRART